MTKSTTSSKTLPVLDPHHDEQLHKDSAIAKQVSRERGTRTIRTKAELDRLGFGAKQQLPPGIGFPIHDVRGERPFVFFRPDEPRMDKRKGKPRKYEFPAQIKMAIDVPPRCREHLGNPGVPLAFTEGPKKADALASRDVAVVDLIGVWNFRGTNEQNGKTVLADLEYIAFKDRRDNPRVVYLIFDSDIMLKIEVYNALKRLRELLKKRGAAVFVVYLPEGPNGEKTGIDDFFARGGTWEGVQALAQKELRRPPETDIGGRVLLSKVLPDAPLPGGLVVPPGYEVGPGGILAVRLNANTMEENTEAIASAPILIAGRTTDVNNGREAAELLYLRGKKWQRYSASRATICNSREIVRLADFGAPVTSGNAGSLVQYLAEFDAANLGEMPHGKTSGQMGWQGRSGSEGFLWGRRLLLPDQPIPEADTDVEDVKPEEWPEDCIMFRGADAGDEQLAAGFTPAGSFEEWRKTMQRLEAFPRVKLTVTASLAPPLLEIVNGYNFIVDLANPTSRGKTATLRLAASCWGNPDERAPESVLGTWDATRVWIERASAILNNMPLLLDDTKRARHPRIVAQTLYDVASGRGRGRGSREGLGRSGSWSTVLICTGEQPATSFTEDGGTRARVLTLWGSPFEAVSKEVGKLVAEVDLEARENYGHAGPKFVQFLLDHRELWPQYRQKHGRYQREYAERAAGNPVLGRMGDYFATLKLAAELATNWAHVLPWESFDPVEPLWDALAGETAEADRAETALRLVLSWADANQHAFWGRHRVNGDGEGIPPSQGYAGKWDRDGETFRWEYLGFSPHRLKGLLESYGFDYESTVRTWRERGWICVTKEGDKVKNTRTARIDGKVTRVVAITRETIKRFEDE